MFLIKLFRLPTPKDLGWSKEYNALGIRSFAQDGQKTWEDYYEYLEEKYPVRSFFAVSLPDMFNRKFLWSLTRKVSDGIYWLKSHLFQYHMLDLRQPKGPDEYRYGWREPSEKMLYAMFNCLKEFVDNYGCSTFYLKEKLSEVSNEDEKKALQYQLEWQEEAERLYHWWVVERANEWERIQDLQDKWFINRKKPEGDKFFKLLGEKEQEYEDKTTEMCIRLIKIRKHLWL